MLCITLFEVNKVGKTSNLYLQFISKFDDSFHCTLDAPLVQGSLWSLFKSSASLKCAKCFKWSTKFLLGGEMHLSGFVLSFLELAELEKKHLRSQLHHPTNYRKGWLHGITGSAFRAVLDLIWLLSKICIEIFPQKKRKKKKLWHKIEAWAAANEKFHMLANFYGFNYVLLIACRFTTCGFQHYSTYANKLWNRPVLKTGSYGPKEQFISLQQLSSFGRLWRHSTAKL